MMVASVGGETQTQALTPIGFIPLPSSSVASLSS
jgi:hypothetical protein